MIVVTIIGILAAISLPAYRNYVARAQAVEGLTATAGLRSNIAIYYWETGVIPDSTVSSLTVQATELSGKYFSGGGATIGAGGAISVNYDHGVVEGETLVLTPIFGSSNRQVVSWSCAFGSADAHENWLPTGCQ